MAIGSMMEGNHIKNPDLALRPHCEPWETGCTLGVATLSEPVAKLDALNESRCAGDGCCCQQQRNEGVKLTDIATSKSRRSQLSTNALGRAQIQRCAACGHAWRARGTANIGHHAMLTLLGLLTLHPRQCVPFGQHDRDRSVSALRRGSMVQAASGDADDA